MIDRKVILPLAREMLIKRRHTQMRIHLKNKIDVNTFSAMASSRSTSTLFSLSLKCVYTMHARQPSDALSTLITSLPINKSSFAILQVYRSTMVKWHIIPGWSTVMNHRKISNARAADRRSRDIKSSLWRRCSKTRSTWQALNARDWLVN